MPTPLPGIIQPDYGRTIDAFRTGKQDFLEQQKRDLLKEAGGLAAAGNMAGARNKLYSGGDFTGAGNVSGEMRAQSAEQRAIQAHAASLDDAKLAKAAKSQELLGNMASKIKTPEQLEQAKAILKARGLDASGVTFDQLPMLIQQGITTQQAFQNELEQRRLQVEEGREKFSQRHTDRSFKNTIEQQQLAQSNADRSYFSGRDDAKFSQDQQTRTFDAGRDDAAALALHRNTLASIADAKAKAAATKAAAPKPLTESQATARAYLGEIDAVNKRLSPLSTDGKANPDSVLTEKGESPLNANLDQIAANSYTPSLISNKLLNKKEKQFLQSAEQFISVLLYKRSGAQISSEEFGRNFRIYFPQPGDDQQTLRQKAAARNQVISGLKIQGGFDAPGAPDAQGASPADMSDDELGSLFQ